MKIFVILLKTMAIGLLLALLLGSGACVLLDISMLANNQGIFGGALPFNDKILFLFMTFVAIALAVGAGYGIYTLIGSFGSSPEKSRTDSGDEL